MTALPACPRLGRLLLPTLALLAGCAAPVTPDLVITNARVFTNDPARPWAQAVAVRGDRVIAVGETAALAAMAAPSTRQIDAGGRVLVPGFNDARVDLPLEPPTPAALTALDRTAVSRGVTSLQVIAGGPMRSLVAAAREATRLARWRLIRSPEDTATLAAADPTVTVRQDETPFLPPQPGVRLVANGVAWRLADDRPEGRRATDRSRLDLVVGWAYGAEDPIVMAGGGRQWAAALTRVGLPEVWQRKRPRFDLDAVDDPEAATAFLRLGVTVVWTPAVHRFEPQAGPGPFSHPTHYAGHYADAGLVIALGSAGVPDPAATLAAATGVTGRAGGRALTREEAVRAMTWGSAYVEKGERDKGWLSPGTLADLVILSEDVFTAPAERLAGITSILTVVGGTIVYDAGVLPK